jgi:hypothetical protein
MRRLVRALCFFLSFALEVKIHAGGVDGHKAEEPSSIHKVGSAETVVWPLGCDWGKQKNCAIQNTGPVSFRSHVNSSQISFGANSVARREHGSFELIQGRFLIESFDHSKWKTLYGTIEMQSGQALVFVGRKSLVVSPLSDQLQVRVVGDDPVSIPVGYEGEFFGVNAQGKSLVAYPRVANPHKLIPSWARLYQGSENEFRVLIEGYRKVWREQLKTAILWHRGEVERQIASHNQKLEEAKRRRIRREKENARLRQMFRNKNYL